MYIVYSEDFQEVKGKFNEMGDALKDAIEWAEWDDIPVSVYRGTISNINRCFMLDGYGAAEELRMMFGEMYLEDEE